MHKWQALAAMTLTWICNFSKVEQGEQGGDPLARGSPHSSEAQSGKEDVAKAPTPSLMRSSWKT